MTPTGLSQFYDAAGLIVPLVLAIVCHEIAHGLVARMLGDATAAEQGRLTLNPFKHIDPIGTIVLPGMLALAHAPVFGWAKPVPVNAWRLRNPRRDMMLVGAAGPAMNLVLAVLAAVVLGLLIRGVGMDGVIGLAGFAARNLGHFIAINLFLALFNLLPVPPFDGSHIVEGLLPLGLARSYARLRRYGLALAVVLIVVLPLVAGVSVIAKVVGPPFDVLFGGLMRLVALVAGVPFGADSV